MRALVLVLVAVVGTAGCARTPAAPTTPPTADRTTAAGASEWMADLCATASDLRGGLWTSAEATGPLRQRLHDQLNTAAEEVDAALDALDAMPAAPVEGGDAAVTQLGDELTDLRDALVRGRGDLDALPADAGEDRLGQVVGTVWPRAAARAADPFAEVGISDAMRGAAAGPDCAPFTF